MSNEFDYSDLKEELKNKRVIVFGGFSKLGYEDETALNARIKDRIELDIQKYGKDNVAVVAGATSVGIGVCYKIAKDLGITTYGIVSETKKDHGVDQYCDKTVFISDPNRTSQTLDKSGSSYMVDIAKNNGSLVYYGGGDVAVSEIKEAVAKNILFEVDTTFKPNPENFAKKQATNPNLDPTPLATFLKNNPINISYALDSSGNQHPIYFYEKEVKLNNAERFVAKFDNANFNEFKQILIDKMAQSEKNYDKTNMTSLHNEANDIKKNEKSYMDGFSKKLEEIRKNLHIFSNNETNNHKPK